MTEVLHRIFGGYSYVGSEICPGQHGKGCPGSENRHAKVDLEEFKALDQERRSLLQEVEADKSQRNTVSAEISQMKRNGEDATEKITAMRALGDKIAEADKR